MLQIRMPQTRSCVNGCDTSLKLTNHQQLSCSSQVTFLTMCATSSEYGIFPSSVNPSGRTEACDSECRVTASTYTPQLDATPRPILHYMAKTYFALTATCLLMTNLG